MANQPDDVQTRLARIERYQWWTTAASWLTVAVTIYALLRPRAPSLEE